VAALGKYRLRIIVSALGPTTTVLKPTPWSRLFLAWLAGPAALLLLSRFAWREPAIAWALISLLPIYPLPAGRLIPRSVTHVLSAVLAFALALGTLPHAPLLLMFAVAFVVNVAWLVARPLSIDPERDDLRRGVELMRAGDARTALHYLRDAFDAAPSDGTAACHAWALIELGRLDEATRLLEHPTAGPRLFSQLMAALFYAARYPEAARVGERSWTMKEEARTAFNLACTYARLEQPEAALGWLSRALDVGWRDLAGLDEDPDLAPLRARPEWAPLRARLTSLGPRA
jgi:tetratricopeptide (TPR) repeat protein